MNRSIYLLPGRGRPLNEGLGAELHARGYDVFGRELVGDFAKRPFREQVDIVANDLKSGFWHDDAMVIGSSFGAYLFLHAQSGLDPFIGRVLLLSPIVGEASNEEAMMFFVPPGARRLQDLVNSGKYPAPAKCEIHVGENDRQSHPAVVMGIGQNLGLSVSVVPGNGHRLDANYVREVLDTWLTEAEKVQI